MYLTLTPNLTQFGMASLAWSNIISRTNPLHYTCLLYKLLKISLFIGPKRPRGKSSNCHINWLARAGRSILVTKYKADVLVPLSHSAAHNRVSNAVDFFSLLDILSKII